MNVIGFDDGPFAREHRGDVLLVGVVCAGTRVDGIVSGRIRRDGANATRVMIDVVRASQFRTHLKAVVLQGIAVGGFNVVDIHALSAGLDVPVLVVMRRRPDLEAVRQALLGDGHGARPPVPGAARKWQLIEAAGTPEPLGVSGRALRGAAGPTGIGKAVVGPLWVQRAGLSLPEARALVKNTTLHGNLPEPLRLAHLIAGGITTGRSRGRA
ncbi:MAG: hypothetical protein JWP97_772 [Labilithrix sp.]|nr:hypothetical protein [Labilithrix sp.]